MAVDSDLSPLIAEAEVIVSVIKGQAEGNLQHSMEARWEETLSRLRGKNFENVLQASNSCHSLVISPFLQFLTQSLAQYSLQFCNIFIGSNI